MKRLATKEKDHEQFSSKLDCPPNPGGDPRKLKN
jgi:hypothetical protein